ncbi:hypothetical protein EYF80_004734 [Liparis tanakae]|uniref:Uncharacterized protein n=1 Tax=Liparis tanakae TaxID=230148 RepID=A0A4Z2J4H1_9TELE|nr:hypothetical protein EYF80_004734 [Liparis tanakae]
MHAFPRRWREGAYITRGGLLRCAGYASHDLDPLMHLVSISTFTCSSYRKHMPTGVNITSKASYLNAKSDQLRSPS